jgi:hypothetical protein
MRAKSKKILLSFVGTNDAGKMKGGQDGAILTVFRERSFDDVHLLWNSSKNPEVDFKSIAEYVSEEITKRGLSGKVYQHEFHCNDVTNHNEIYPQLLSFCKSLEIGPEKKYTAAIASGTPAMQVCWILMAESGDFPIELIRSNEPRYGKPLVIPIKLGTGLPRILRLEEENKQLQKDKEELIPPLVINVKNGLANVNGVTLDLSPIEFCYYRYFAERKLISDEFERISGILVPAIFVENLLLYRKESFPDKEVSEKQKRELRDRGISSATFRSNVSKANNGIHNVLKNKSHAKFFEIAIEGKKNSKLYGLRLPKAKIIIKRK